ncbi:MAG: FMN-binding protein [Saccharospirillum sp.]|nr:FMN-binding protein [Saccharospirillum sp.]
MKLYTKHAIVAGALFAALATPIHADTFSGSALGYNGTIELEVEWGEGQVSDIRVVSHGDTPSIAEPVFVELTQKIIELQNTDIDGISGATYTSQGFLQAVGNAIRSAQEGHEHQDVSTTRSGFSSDPFTLVDGRYRGMFGDGGDQQVVVQFHLRDGVLFDLSFRHLYYKGDDYRRMDDQHPLYAVKRQHEQALSHLEGKTLESIEELKRPGDYIEDIDGFSGATIRGSKLYSTFNDALNRGVYTPDGEINIEFGYYADGRYRGTFGDRGEQQVSIQFDLVDNRFQNLRFRHLAYSGTDYRQLKEGDQLYPVAQQHQQILDYLDGKVLATIVDLHHPSQLIQDVDGFTGATVRSNKVVSAIMNALSRQAYTPSDTTKLSLPEPADGRYRGIFEDSGVQQVSIQFFVENGLIKNPSFRHLYYSGTDYRALQPGDTLYPVLQQHQAILEYIDGKPVQTLLDLHRTADFIPDVDGFTGATIRGNKVFSAMIDALNRGLY